MRRCWAGVVLVACALLCGAAQPQPPPTPSPPAAEPAELVVTAVAFEESASSAGQEALAALLREAMAARSVRARAAEPPPACRAPHAPDSPACLRAVLALLAQGALHAALLPVPLGALPPAPRLRDAGVEAGGALEDGAGARRDCWALPAEGRERGRGRGHGEGGSLLSLAELAREETAALYRLAPEDAAVLAPSPRYFCSALDEEEGRAEPCPGSLATVLVGPPSEARAVLEAGAAAGLRLQALALGGEWEPARALRALAGRGAPGVACGRALDAAALRAAGARRLGPPPCDALVCAFEARPLMKLSAARELARSPGAARALDRLALPAGGAAALTGRARLLGPAAAAQEALARAAVGGAREVRVAVLVPRSTRREVGDARALVAAAELAEEDEAALRAERVERAERDGSGPGAEEVRYKVELVDSGCAAPRAFKYLTDALGSEFHALSGVAGPLCAGAFGAVSRQSGALALPVLAYGPQAEGGGAVLLAAGAAQERVPALAAVLRALGWRRAALLSEAGGRAALDAARLGVELAVHVELPEGEDLAEDLVERWARRAAALSARVLVLALEDGRAARAALCAGARHGLTPGRGAAFLLAAAPPPAWLRAAPPAGCPLRAQAEGLLTLQPAWAARWEAGDGGEWARRWGRRAAAEPDAAPPAVAALLYDALRLWAAALARLLRVHPEALDDLHRADTVASLMEDATTTPYAGLTGSFEWEGLARRDALLVQQWRGGRALALGRWAGGALQLDPGALRWAAPGGGAPDDGSARCALAGLARALGSDCGAAWLCAGALALLALAAPLALLAWRCRRRAAREHRARLAALGMRALGPGAGEPDRWELPRERVVINRKLGAGAFGAVYGGHALLGSGEARAWAAVAVKTLKAGAGTEEKLDFLSEAEALKRFSHSRVVRLLGVVTRTEPVCTVMEYMLYGDLKGYLVARRHLAAAAGAEGADGAEADDVTPARLTGMARDAALALEYLARLRYVHRDVAARNCLVSASRRVKLADFGMTRVVFENDYYRFGRKGMLPVRWMAPESLALGVFSSASDVWSFGVLLYEIITFGALPYRGLPNAEVLERAKAGHPPPLPPALDPQLEALIRACWRRERAARPTATALAGFLAEWPRLLTPSLAAPDALDEPLPSRATDRPKEVPWTSWAAPTSAGTDSTYLSAPPTPPAPLDSDPFLPPPAPPAPPTPPAPLDSDPFLPPAPPAPPPAAS